MKKKLGKPFNLESVKRIIRAVKRIERLRLPPVEPKINTAVNVYLCGVTLTNVDHEADDGDWQIVTCEVKVADPEADVACDSDLPVADADSEAVAGPGLVSLDPPLYFRARLPTLNEGKRLASGTIVQCLRGNGWWNVVSANACEKKIPAE